MKRNEFGENEKRISKANIIITIIAVIAISITGVIYAMNLADSGTETIYMETTSELT